MPFDTESKDDTFFVGMVLVSGAVLGGLIVGLFCLVVWVIIP